MENITRHFIITVDTEGDNLWAWDGHSNISTENAIFIPRFQELCEKFNFIPTYLCNWEMANDQRFVNYALSKLGQGKCEIGTHLHAWNTPPFYELEQDDTSGKPYLIEYPEDIMEKKIVAITDLIEKRFKVSPISHRAGRWAMDDRYFELLYKYGYIADCSVTPGVNWNKNRGETPNFYGTDYSKYSNKVTKMHGIIEIPVSTMISHKLFNQAYKDVWNYEQRRRVWWLRPKGDNLKQMKYLIRCREQSHIEYLEFMIHSSELMPGGSPTFSTKEDVEKLYMDMEKIFELIAPKYTGIALGDYAKIIMER